MDYADPRLVAIYDALRPPGEDERFYVDLAGLPPKTILDMGCGTGRLASDLAGLGHHVTGADPAVAMLEIARKREGGNKVHWVKSDAGGLSLATRFDLIIMTGHAFQKLLTDDEVSAALRAFARHLKPEGTLAFETRNPARREWEEWIPGLSRETVTLPDGSPVEVHNDIRAVAGELVTYETHVSFGPRDKVVGADTLRFMGESELARHLADAGFARQNWYGNWDRSPVGPDRPELIVICRLGGRPGPVTPWAPAIRE
jgi:ubiquinone/menaquinone biosynthesis C-methylase UbiE